MSIQGSNFSSVPVVSIAWNSRPNAENTVCDLHITGTRAADDLERLTTELRRSGFEIVNSLRHSDCACLVLSRGRGAQLIDNSAIKAIVVAANTVQMSVLH